MNTVMSMVKGKVQRSCAQAQANVRYATSLLFKDERGDTNFVSILILLGIALALAAVFMAFRNQIVDFIGSQMTAFGSAVQSQSGVTNANLSAKTGVK